MTLAQYLGDSHTHTIPLTWQGAAFSPGENWALIWTLKAAATDLDAAALVQKASGAGIVASTSNALVSLVPDDTSALAAVAGLVWDIQAQHVTTGEVRTVAAGRMKLIRDTTRLTTTSVPVVTTETPLPFPSPAVSIHAATEKTTPVDADEFGIADSEATWGLKRLSWSNIKSALGTVFATLAQGALAETAVQPGSLGDSASRNVGNSAGTVAAGDDARFSSGGSGGILENIEGLNRAFDDFMRFDVSTEADPYRLTITGFSDSMPGNPAGWIVNDLQQRYGVGMLFTPNLGQSWNGAAPTLSSGAQYVTSQNAFSPRTGTADFSRVPNGLEINIPVGGSYALATPDLAANPQGLTYMPGGSLAEARISTDRNVIPLQNGIQKVRVFYVKLPGAGTITATITQSQLADVASSANAAAAEALGYIDLVPADVFAPMTLTITVSTADVRFLGAAFFSGAGVGYLSSAMGSTMMDEQLTGLRSGNWNQVYKDLCTAVNTSMVLHCQRASDAGTEANNYAANYQIFFDAYQQQGLAQVVFEEPHRDVENALTTATINATLQSLCATERIAFFRSQRAVLAGSSTALGWGDGDNIHRDAREWRYVAGLFLAQVGYFSSAMATVGAPLSRPALAAERFRLFALSRSRQSAFVGRGGVYYSTTWTGAGFGNPTTAAELGFKFATAAGVAGHCAGVFGQFLGGSSQLDTTAGDITINGNGYRNLNLPAGGGHRAALIFGKAATQITDITAIAARCFGLEFAHGTDLGGGLTANEHVRIFAHNGSAMTYSRWVPCTTSGAPSSTGFAFILRWRKQLGIFSLWCNGNNAVIFPRCSLAVSALQSAACEGSYGQGYIRTSGTGHTAGKMEWFSLACEFGSFYAPDAL